MLRLARPRNSLVEVAEQDGRGRMVSPKQRTEMLQVGQVFVPRPPVAATRADVRVALRDADPDEANRSARRVGGAGHESAGRKGRGSDHVHVAPRVAAPKQNLSATGRAEDA